MKYLRHVEEIYAYLDYIIILISQHNTQETEINFNCNEF
jgi:hypothetical protein